VAVNGAFSSGGGNGEGKQGARKVKGAVAMIHFAVGGRGCCTGEVSRWWQQQTKKAAAAWHSGRFGLVGGPRHKEGKAAQEEERGDGSGEGGSPEGGEEGASRPRGEGGQELAGLGQGGLGRMLSGLARLRRAIG
jgi:hypothetical protein